MKHLVLPHDLNFPGKSSQELYLFIAGLAKEMAGSDAAVIYIRDSYSNQVEALSASDNSVQLDDGLRSLCNHASIVSEPISVEDIGCDHRFKDYQAVASAQNISSFAGFPLASELGSVTGSLCLFGKHSSPLDPDQLTQLSHLSKIILALFTAEHQRPSLGEGSSDDSELINTGGRQRDLLSRDAFIARLESCLSTADKVSFAVLRCRLYDYDRVSANLGSSFAIEYINEAIRRLKVSVPRGYLLGRFADNEIVALVIGSFSEDRLSAIAGRIINLFGQPFRQESQSAPIDVAIGIVVNNSDYNSADLILADSSMALRMAMRAGSSSYRFIDSESRLQARSSYMLEADIRKALADKVFEPYFQPIIDLYSKEIIGFEALARWPQGSALVSPAEFMPVVAEMGVTGELDLLIIEKSLAAISIMAMIVPLRPMVLSVNMSGPLAEDSLLRKRLLDMIDMSNMPLGWKLQVELLEDSFQVGGHLFDEFLAGLSERGVQIAIDDFGTGYSSLSRLISLPIDGVKIDRAFISRIEEESESPRTLLKTMLGMMSDLGMSVTAEGIETDGQMKWLVKNTVTKAQGFLFSKPLSMSDACRQLRELDYRPPAIPLAGEGAEFPSIRRRFSLRRLPLFDRRNS